MVVEGEKHACAVVNGNKDVYCWGQGTYGQLGNGGTSNYAVPQKVIGLPSGQTIVDIASADRVTCALLSGEDLYCWGNNTGIDYLGVSRSSMTYTSTPVKVLNRADP